MIPGSCDEIKLETTIPAQFVEIMDRLREDETGTHVREPCSREDYIRAAVMLRLIKAIALIEAEGISENGGAG